MLCNGAVLNLLTFSREAAVVKVIVAAAFPLGSYMTASHRRVTRENPPTQLCAQLEPFAVLLSHSQP